MCLMGGRGIGAASAGLGGNAFELPVDPCWDPHLRSRTLGGDRKKKRLQNASGGNEFLPPGGWGPPPRGRLSRFQGHVSIAGDPGGGQGNRGRDYKSNLDLGDLRDPPTRT